jgi:hypothetical protein
VEESGCTDSYQSVKRFVRKLRSIQPDRDWRLECQPGEELQLDFSLGAPIHDAHRIDGARGVGRGRVFLTGFLFLVASSGLVLAFYFSRALLNMLRSAAESLK